MEFAVIEFPGVVKNSENAVKMLGGMIAIASSLTGVRPMGLKFQPDNPYLSSLQAEKQNLSGLSSGQLQLVVRVRRKKSDHNAPCSVECLGTVSTRFFFKAIADFQYLPLRRVNDTEYEDLVPKLVPDNFTSALGWWDPTDDEQVADATPHFLPPYLFSRYNTQSMKIMGPETDRQCRETPVISHGKNLRSERRALTVTVDANDPFPAAPPEAVVQDVDQRVRNDDLQRRVKELFDERPMWTRPAVINRTGLDGGTLKVLFAKYAFYIISGPWGRLWCRFGYDPRKDPAAKKYQTVVVSFRHSKFIPEKQRLKVLSADRSHNPSSIGQAVIDVGEVDHIYRPGQLPSVRQMWYCICDIQLPEAQKVLRDDFFATLKKCDEAQGWLPQDVINSIRKAVKDDVQRSGQQLEEGDEDSSDASEGGDSDLGGRNDGDENGDDSPSDDEFDFPEEDLSDAAL